MTKSLSFTAMEDMLCVLRERLSSDFVYVCEGSKAAVSVEQIVMKCAEISVMGRSLVTSLVGRAEVAK